MREQTVPGSLGFRFGFARTRFLLRLHIGVGLGRGFQHRKSTSSSRERAGVFGMVENHLSKSYAEQLAALLKGPQEARFFEELGRTVTQYALADNAMHEAARNFIGLPSKKARLLLAGMRNSDVKKRALDVARLEMRPSDDIAEFETLWAQFDLIGTDRDKLVHRVVDYVGDKMKVTNHHTARDIDKTETDEFSLTDIQSMWFDCNAIMLRFFALTMDPSSPMREQARKAGSGPWRYKPDAPTSPSHDKTKRSEKELPHQPKASRA
jgi:hypothetical protein